MSSRHVKPTKTPRHKPKPKRPTSERKSSHRVVRTTAPTRPPRRVSTGLSTPQRTLLGGIRSRPYFPDVDSPYAVAGNPLNHRTVSISGDLFSGIKMNVRIPWADVNDAFTPSSSVPTGGLSMIGNATTGGSFTTRTGVGVVCLNPVYCNMVYNQTTTTTDKIQGMAQASATSLPILGAGFSMYRCTKLTFHHEPAGTTAQVRNFVFAYSTDPGSVVTGIRSVFSSIESLLPAATVNPSRTYLEQTTNSVIFPVWQAWSMDCPVDPTWRNMWAPAIYTGAAFGAYNLATLRDTSFGSVSCYNLTGNAAGPQGRIWMEASFEFKDATPINTTPEGLFLLAPFTSNEVKMESKEEAKETEDFYRQKSRFKSDQILDIEDEKQLLQSCPVTPMVQSDDDIEVVSPPKYRPTPSSNIGGSLQTPKKPSNKTSQPSSVPVSK